MNEAISIRKATGNENVPNSAVKRGKGDKAVQPSAAFFHHLASALIPRSPQLPPRANPDKKMISRLYEATAKNLPPIIARGDLKGGVQPIADYGDQRPHPETGSGFNARLRGEEHSPSIPPNQKLVKKIPLPPDRGVTIALPPIIARGDLKGGVQPIADYGDQRPHPETGSGSNARLRGEDHSPSIPPDQKLVKKIPLPPDRGVTIALPPIIARGDLKGGVQPIADYGDQRPHPETGSGSNARLRGEEHSPPQTSEGNPVKNWLPLVKGGLGPLGGGKNFSPFPQPLPIAELVQTVRLTGAGSGRELLLHLKPATFGRAIVAITRLEDGVRLDFHLEEPEARKAVEAQANHLREALSAVGIHKLEIDIRTLPPDQPSAELNLLSERDPRQQTTAEPQSPFSDDSGDKGEVESALRQDAPRFYGYNTFDMVA